MHHLYRHFSADGELLYVGISQNPFKRFEAHQQNSSWARRVKRIAIEDFESLMDARAAERKAIAEENPAYNIRHSKQADRAALKRKALRADDPLRGWRVVARERSTMIYPPFRGAPLIALPILTNNPSAQKIARVMLDRFGAPEAIWNSLSR